VFATAIVDAHALGAGGVKANAGTLAPELNGDGSVLVFWSFSTNLSPDFLGVASGASTGQVYARDLDSGSVTVVSRASGTGPVGNATSVYPSVSADGRFVAFQSGATNLSLDDGDAQRDVYVRDLQSGTTTLVSRADGLAGIKGNRASDGGTISADGRYVVFGSESTNLSADDSDAATDVYVRDLQAHTTTLVSRATGAAGAKANRAAFGGSISSAGPTVIFYSISTNLDPDDADTVEDVFVRDLSANTTTLISRASGAGGAKANGLSTAAGIADNGRLAAFKSRATNLSPDDSDLFTDLYVRDLETGVTVLASRSSGASGFKDAASVLGGASFSQDGRLLAYDTAARNHPDDGGTDIRDYDVYVRDLQTQTTALVSRTSGNGAAKANVRSYDSSLSGDGRVVAFKSEATNLAADDHSEDEDSYVRDLLSFETSLEGRATPGYFRYVRPKIASPFFTALVPASRACTAPNRMHGEPLAFDSCSPPTPVSPNVTVGGGDSSARSVGHVKLAVRSGDPGTPADEADVRIGFSLTNVMRTSDASDYTGELAGRVAVRLTDQMHEPSGRDEGTVEDFDLAFTIPCAVTASSSDGSACSLTTTTDTVLPGFAPERKRSVYELAQFKVYDGGPDEDTATPADDALFAVQGIFVP
jgi:hypothetical protein